MSGAKGPKARGILPAQTGAPMEKAGAYSASNASRPRVMEAQNKSFNLAAVRRWSPGGRSIAATGAIEASVLEDQVVDFMLGQNRSLVSTT